MPRPQSSAGGLTDIRDSEVIATLSGALQVFNFSPSAGKDATPRLFARAQMFERYRFVSFRAEYCPGVGTATAGNVAIGIAPGKTIAAVVDQATILKLKPSNYTPTWKATSVQLGRLIDAQRFMHVNTEKSTDDDEVSFTLYLFGTKGGGMIRISYHVQLAYPVPF